MRCLRRIVNVKWLEKIPKTTVLDRACIPSMYTQLTLRRMRCLGHVARIENDRIAKDDDDV